MSIRLNKDEIKKLESKLYSLEHTLLEAELFFQRLRSKYGFLNIVVMKIRELQLAVSNCKKDIEQYKRKTFV